MSVENSTTQVQHGPHPKALAPANLALTAILSVFGALVGMQIMATLGVTPSTSLIGALVAMTLARVPLVFFRGFRNIHAQNLAQTSISSATFGAANSLFLPIGIPYLFGLPNMIVPMLIGVSAAMLLDAWLLYRLYNTPAFPAKNPWPLGIAAAEAIKAGDSGGRQAKVLGVGLIAGIAGAVAGLPMSALGIAMLGGFAAMVAFGAGLLTRAYLPDLTGFDINAMYVPHGVMIGAGLIALFQVGRAVISAHRKSKDAGTDADSLDANGAARLGRSLGLGGIGYLVISLGLALGTGLATQMSFGMLVGFILFAMAAAFVHEIIVGISAMHAGWFPAFAVALITLIVGIMVGFPPEALVVLAGFSAATGPAFADMGYDYKAGFLLRGENADPAFELEGRKQQMIAGMVGFITAIVVVAVSYNVYFAQGLTAPIDAAYVAAINAGVSAETARNLLIWAIPGAIIQLVGGSKRQLGILLGTGLLILSPKAGWLVLVGLILRVAYKRWKGEERAGDIGNFAGGVIAGDALYSFFSGAFKATR
ncbi:MAG: OPT/YSL family transporter [Propioniciclava sp.]